MGDKSGISWTDATWNPTTGCSKVSEGCRNCYAAALAPRLHAMGQKGYTELPWTARNAAENVMCHEDRLEMPLRWKRPRRIFVNSMSDLFHELVPDDFIDKVFAVMALAPQHTFQILTKRPERMMRYTTKWDVAPRVRVEAHTLRGRMGRMALPSEEWPLPNVWLGTSVEDQRAADERIPHLLETPAAVRFLSCEPLLGPVDLTDVSNARDIVPDYFDALTGTSYPSSGHPPIQYDTPTIDWVIAGGESGPGYRPMNLDWVRSLRSQCVAAGVPFFGKQASGPRNEMPLPEDLQVRQMPPTRTEVAT